MPTWSGSTSITSRSGANYTAKITITVNCQSWKYVGIGSYGTQSFGRQYIYWTNGGSAETWSTTQTGSTLTSKTVTFGTYYLNAQQTTGSGMENITSNSWSVTIPAAKFTVTFNPGENATVSTTSKEVTYNSTYHTLPTPVKPNYNFLGWFTAGGTEITSDSTVKIEADTTLYAKWEANTIMRISDGNVVKDCTKMYFSDGQEIKEITGCFFSDGTNIYQGI